MAGGAFIMLHLSKKIGLLVENYSPSISFVLREHVGGLFSKSSQLELLLVVDKFSKSNATLASGSRSELNLSLSGKAWGFQV